MKDWRTCSDLRKKWLESSAKCWSLSRGSSGGGLPNKEVNPSLYGMPWVEAKQDLSVYCGTLMRVLFYRGLFVLCCCSSRVVMCHLVSQVITFGIWCCSVCLTGRRFVPRAISWCPGPQAMSCALPPLGTLLCSAQCTSEVWACAALD